MFNRISPLILALVVLTGHQPIASQSIGNSFKGFDLVDKTGNIRKPADVRDLYQMLGVFTPVDLNNGFRINSSSSLFGSMRAVATSSLYVNLIILTGAPDWMQPITNDALCVDANSRLPNL